MKKSFKVQFLTKNFVGAHVHLPRSGARVGSLKDWPCLKYNAPEKENRLTLGLNTAKNTDYMTKRFKLKLLRI